MTALRQQLESCENKVAELGNERDVPEDKELEEAIAMSKTAEATAEISQAAIAARQHLQYLQHLRQHLLQRQHLQYLEQLMVSQRM